MQHSGRTPGYMLLPNYPNALPHPSRRLQCTWSRPEYGTSPDYPNTVQHPITRIHTSTRIPSNIYRQAAIYIRWFLFCACCSKSPSEEHQAMFPIRNSNKHIKQIDRVVFEEREGAVIRLKKARNRRTSSRVNHYVFSCEI